MESNLTITIFAEEYRDLVKTKCNYDLLVSLLLSESELDYKDDLRVRGSSAAFIEQLEPMVYGLRKKELLDEREKRLAEYKTEGD